MSLRLYNFKIRIFVNQIVRDGNSYLRPLIKIMSGVEYTSVRQDLEDASRLIRRHPSLITVQKRFF